MNIKNLKTTDVDTKFADNSTEFIETTTHFMDNELFYPMCKYLCLYDIKFFRKLRVCLSDTYSEKFVSIHSEYLLKLMNTLYDIRLIRWENDESNTTEQYFYELSERVFQLTIELNDTEETLQFPK